MRHAGGNNSSLCFPRLKGRDGGRKELGWGGIQKIIPHTNTSFISTFFFFFFFLLLLSSFLITKQCCQVGEFLSFSPPGHRLWLRSIPLTIFDRDSDRKIHRIWQHCNRRRRLQGATQVTYLKRERGIFMTP